ncbi:MAG: hypothetical protein ABIS67_11045 [Candidatus Eisenbacteria bacterium]
MVPTFVSIGVGVLVGLLQGSFFEWVYHRYWLHRPWLPPQMFTAHTLVHHQLCKHDDTFHVHDEEQEEALTFQWWGGPALITLNLLPWIGVCWLLRDVLTLQQSIAYLGGFYASMFSYYLAYEGLHYLMHKPSIAWIERSAPFRFIEKHHRIHHAHMGRNYNVVLPLADLCLGTLMLRDPLAPRRTEPSARLIARRHSKFGKRHAGGQSDGHAESPAAGHTNGQSAPPAEAELEVSAPH